ncbi:L,D-transpeptidase family protein [Pelagibacteraceae bacterium]|jgi:L,D-peptidoglycan transpeptidase YkuD (ErfK/YbiS/YcfS/YnhG family)|nr:L,D-transpeptidase family protein [Pelagibacteraceae bacterium]|tara:strand:+ start:2495 stop:2986 length:492 start_codon:yes stop_codon:yes gene_type:complete
MHIELRNKKLIFGKYRVKCALGKRGISVKKKEGDNITPKGTYKILNILYRKDRIPNIKTSLKKIAIKRNMGWCDDPKSKKYNMLISFPFSFKAEKLYKRRNIYDIVLVLDYNLKPVVKNKGSAIFIHIASKNYDKTAGCIAISKYNIKKLIKLIDKKSLLKIL